MSTKKSFENNVPCLFAIVFTIVIIFSIVGSQNVGAQILYYPANTADIFGLSQFVPAPLPLPGGTQPYNLYYPSIGAPPAVLVPPPTPSSYSRAAATVIDPFVYAPPEVTYTDFSYWLTSSSPSAFPCPQWLQDNQKKAYRKK